MRRKKYTIIILLILLILESIYLLASNAEKHRLENKAEREAEHDFIEGISNVMSLYNLDHSFRSDLF